MKTSEDKAIEQLRKPRRQISQEFGNDPKRLVEHYIKLQKKHKKRLLNHVNREDREIVRG